MNVLLIDGHPDEGRYCSHLLDVYERALPDNAEVRRIAVRDLTFSPNLGHGYAKRTDWEEDIDAVARALDWCDHVSFCFPMWWAAEPAMLKGLLDRVVLPGFMFAYHEHDTFWDRLMVGRSADAIITMDTPPWYLWLAYGNSIVRRWKKQILGFVGFKPARILALGQIKRGGVEKHGQKWEARVRRLAMTIAPARATEKVPRLERFLGA